MRRFRIGSLLLVGISILLVSLPAPSQRGGEYTRPLRPVVRGSRGAVAGGTSLGTEAGMRLFHAGGNAVDAGVAAMFAGAVVEYSHFGWGGEAPILIRTRDGHVYSIAGVGTAPKLATADFFRNRRSKPDEQLSVRGPNEREGPIPSSGLLPALVPGMVDAGLVALEHFGTKTFAEVAQPAIELADGAPIDEMRSGSIARSAGFFQRWPTSQRVFLPRGQPPRPGEIFRQPDLARTLRAMAAAEKAAKGGRAAGIEAVRNYFYRGDVARKIGTFCEQNGGLLRYEDMAAFRLEPEEPLKTTFHGYEVYKNGFWTQGAVFLQTLNLLEKYDLAQMRFNSADYLHTLVEALKLAYADRDSYYGDPKFVAPPEELLSKTYAARRARLIDPAAASPDFRPGEIALRPAVHPSAYPGPKTNLSDVLAQRDTTCVNALDKDGVIFSSTPSGAWLPSVIAGDTGIALTQRGQSFLVLKGHPNVIEPGKRPRITLSPTLVTRSGQPYMALSTPGGDNQDQSLLQILLDVIDFGMNVQVAVEAPRFQTRHLVSSFDAHAMYPNSLLLDERIPEAAYRDLAARGHKVERRPPAQNGAAPTAIRFLVDTGVIEAGADPYGMRYADAW
ncbi:MAG: gamma-glutamyltransferase family protein [Acidobacteria bacterium]|nr:gamma-glutamyltransferase family protein [Acidobacteriota bacterium]